MTVAQEPAVFEFGDESEYDSLLTWANKLDGGPSEIPRDLRVGDIIVRRPYGEYQVYRRPPSKSDAGSPVKQNGRDFDVERVHIRLAIYQAVGGPIEEKRLEAAKKAESWIFSASDASSNR